MDKKYQIIYAYRSPYRPLPMNYLPSDVKFLIDSSDIGAWTPKTVYVFSKPIPENQVKQWDLEVIEL